MVGKEVQIHRTFLAGSHISPLTETGAPMSTTLSTIPSVHQNHVSTISCKLRMPRMLYGYYHYCPIALVPASTLTLHELLTKTRPE
jgi:hypothetical protein